MGSLSKWRQYVPNRFPYSVGASITKLAPTAEHCEVDLFSLWRNFFRGRLTYLHQYFGDDMVPALAGKGEVLLVRKLPLYPFMEATFVGDIVVMKDPDSPKDQLVRRVAAVEGDEMVSNDEKDEAFVLDQDQFWVLSDNGAKKFKKISIALPMQEAKDSRTFGPISKENIVGRVIYRLRSADDHGPVENSMCGMNQDWSVLAVELDVDEMARRSSKT